MFIQFFQQKLAIIYFYFQKAKNKPTKSTYICEMIFTFLFSLNSLVAILSSGSTKTHYGAGSENRTRATRSEAWDSTTKLYPHQHIHYTTNITNMQIKTYNLTSFKTNSLPFK